MKREDVLTVEFRSDVTDEQIAEATKSVKEAIQADVGATLEAFCSLEGDPFEGQTFTQAEADRLMDLIRRRVC